MSLDLLKEAIINKLSEKKESGSSKGKKLKPFKSNLPKDLAKAIQASNIKVR